MNWCNKLKLVFRIYSQRIFVTLLLLAMCMVSFYMVDKVLTDYISARYAIWQAENQLGCDPENGFYIQLYGDSRNAENIELIKNFLSEHEAVEGAGYARHSEINVNNFGSEEICDKDEEYQFCAFIACDKDVMSLGNLKLSEEQLEIINNADENCAPIFLGSDYKGKVEIGTTFTFHYGMLFSDVYVAGFLEKNAAWPHDQGLFSGSFGETDDYNLNKGALLVTDDINDYFDSDFYYIVYCVTKEGCYEQVKVDVSRFALENSLKIKIENYGEEIEEKRESSNLLEDNTFIAAVMLLILAVVSVAAATIIYCLMNQGQYGIMIANGLTKGNIIWIINVQNAITVTVAGVAAWFIRDAELFAGEDMSKAELVNYIETLYRQLYVAHDYYMPIILIITGAIILLAASIIPAYIIRKTSLPEMLSQRS